MGIRKAGGSLQALFNRLEGLHLIELFRPWDNSEAGAGGRTPDLVRLAEHGRMAYWLLGRFKLPEGGKCRIGNFKKAAKEPILNHTRASGGIV